jgi:hypothetical protein
MRLLIRDHGGFAVCEDCGGYDWKRLEFVDSDTGREVLCVYSDGHLTLDSRLEDPVELLKDLLPRLGIGVVHNVISE